MFRRRSPLVPTEAQSAEETKPGTTRPGKIRLCCPANHNRASSNTWTNRQILAVTAPRCYLDLMDALRGIKDLKRTPAWERTIRPLLAPRRYQVPNGYMSPEHLAWLMHCTLTCTATEAAQPDPRLDVLWHRYVAVSSAALWMQYEAPVFFFDQATTDALLETDPPADLTFAELRLPYPAFGLVLPLAAGNAFPLMLISYVPGNNLPSPPAEAFQMLAAKPATLPGTPSVKSFSDFYAKAEVSPQFRAHLCVMWHAPGGYASECWVPCEDLSLAEGLRQFEERVIECHGRDLHGNARDSHSAPAMRFVLNFLCWLRYCHPSEGGAIARVAAPAGVHKKTKEIFYRPIMLGDPSATRTPSPQGGTHRSPITHWRRGHWHTVRYGKDSLLRRRQWFRPALVAASRDGDWKRPYRPQ